MNQCVPSWDLDENSSLPGNDVRAHSNSNSLPPDVPTLDYEVAELTWKNGQLAMHGLGPPRVANKPILTSSPTKYSTWDKPRAGGTLESIVNQATRLPDPKTTLYGGGDELVPWFDHHRAMVHPCASASIAVTMDALVPCNNNIIINRNDNQVPSAREMESIPQSGTCVVGSSTRVGSCSGVAAATLDGGIRGDRIARVEINSCDTNGSASESATCGRDSHELTLDTCDKKLGATGFTYPSMESPENTSSAKDYSKSTGDDHDSVCYSRPQRGKCEEEGKKRGTGKSSLSMKRSRAAAIHNQSERKRRDRINQRMKTLQKLVPNSSKTDKASMLDEVIEYLKQLQAQVQIMRMNMASPMMLPLAMQQQLQMSMMHQASPMGMGMGMAGMGMAGIGMTGMGMPGIGMPGMGIMDINNAMGRSSGMPSPPAAAFMPVAGASWDNPGDRVLSTPATSVMTDPLSAFLACQSQLMTFDAYSRLAAMYQQFQHPPGSNSKN